MRDNNEEQKEITTKGTRFNVENHSNEKRKKKPWTPPANIHYIGECLQMPCVIL
jgi:hypothetical protein